MPAHAGTKGNEHADILAGMVTITDGKLMDQADRLTVLSDCLRLKTSMCARHSHCQDSKNCKSRSAQLIQQQKKKTTSNTHKRQQLDQYRTGNKSHHMLLNLWRCGLKYLWTCPGLMVIIFPELTTDQTSKHQHEKHNTMGKQHIHTNSLLPTSDLDTNQSTRGKDAIL